MRCRLLIHGLLLAAILGGCHRAGRPFAPAKLDLERGWVSVAAVPVIRQEGDRDCGAAVTTMLLRYWGLPATQANVRAASGVAPDHGLRADFLRTHLHAHGLQAFLFEGRFGDLEHELARGRPVLVGVLRTVSRDVYAHYQLVVAVNRAREQVVVIDPVDGWSVYSFAGFMREWTPTHFLTMAVLPMPAPE
jgi:ABC-type bacteriocin/lantibiotic exporter with double-glycine peptidase domain